MDKSICIGTHQNSFYYAPENELDLSMVKFHAGYNCTFSKNPQSNKPKKLHNARRNKKKIANLMNNSIMSNSSDPYNYINTSENLLTYESKIRIDKLSRLREKCHLIDDLFTKEILHYNEQQLIIQIIKKVSNKSAVGTQITERLYETDPDHNWYKYIHYYEQYEHIKKCNSGDCPYYDTCRPANDNIISQYCSSFEFLEKQDNSPRMSVDECYAKLEADVKKALDENDKNIHVYIATTGIGKSNIGKKHFDSNYGITYATPTHKLKRDLKGKSNIFCTPDREFSFVKDAKDKILIDMYSYLGDYSKVRDILQKYPEETISYYNDKNRDLKGNCITTHANVHMKENHNDFLWFDESSEASSLKQGCINLNDIKELIDYDKRRDNLFDKLNLNTDIIEKTPEFPFPNEVELLIQDFCMKKITNPDALYEKYIETNGDLVSIFKIKDFLNSDYYYINRDTKGNNFTETINFITLNNSIFKDTFKTILIFSATIDPTIWEKIINQPERVVVHDYSNVKHKGEIIQIYERSYSKSRQKEYDNEIKMIPKNLSTILDANFITYKDFKPNENGIYLGNVEGHNDFENRNLVIAGHYLMPQNSIKLIAKCLGIEFNDKDEREYIEIEYNGIRTYFYTFRNEGLQKIDLYFCNKELVQAIGRNRTLRHNVKTVVFTNFPLKADKYYKSYKEFCTFNDIPSEE
jgi:hypothetical protein